jgi:hypothetical protein
MGKPKSFNKKLSAEQDKTLLSVLNSRFEKNMNRQKGMNWSAIETKLKASPEKL